MKKRDLERLWDEMRAAQADLERVEPIHDKARRDYFRAAKAYWDAWDKWEKNGRKYDKS